MNRIQNVQESDTTGADSSNVARTIKMLTRRTFFSWENHFKTFDF